jgi:hypothetical protein
MDKCCATNPRIMCRVCKQSACMNHIVSFKRVHPMENMLAPSGREMYSCGEIPITYIIESGIVVLEAPGNVYKALKDKAV